MSPAHFTKVRGQVELSGRVDAPEGAEDAGYVPIFVLPESYRPNATVGCGVASESGPLELWIEPDGSVLADSPRRGWIELDGISFEAAEPN